MLDEDDVILYGQGEDDEVEIDDYKIWKKNAAYLYDILITQNMDWPSLTVSWLPISR
ncbi:MAG: hypothetical protein MJ252_00405 [archaeon]|nr:hypothetical protein [archaeon]